jgi:hypothetical protein
MAAGKSIAAEQNAWIVFEDEAGQSLTPPRAHLGPPWAHAGRACARTRLRTGLDGRHDLLQTRQAIPAVLQRA